MSSVHVTVGKAKQSRGTEAQNNTQRTCLGVCACGVWVAAPDVGCGGRRGGGVRGAPGVRTRRHRRARGRFGAPASSFANFSAVPVCVPKNMATASRASCAAADASAWPFAPLDAFPSSAGAPFLSPAPRAASGAEAACARSTRQRQARAGSHCVRRPSLQKGGAAAAALAPAGGALARAYRAQRTRGGFIRRACAQQQGDHARQEQRQRRERKRLR